MPNVGYATLQVIPSVRGIADNIRSQLNAPMQSAGQEAGNTAGQGILSGVGGAMKAGMLAVGAAGGAIFAKGFSNALEQGQVVGKLRATLGATPQEAEKYGKVAGKLYSSAVSDSFQDAADAIKSVVQQGLAPPGATNKQLESIAAKASTVANIMGEDVGRTTAAVSTILKTGLAPNADAAFDILTRGIQLGVNKNEDLLDTFVEYPVQFKKLGLSAEAAMGLLSQGLQAGARDSDFLADGLKEFSIRAVDGSKTSADAFKLLGLDAQKMTAQIARGGPEASAGLQVVLDRLRAMKDPVAQNAAAVGLFGTKAEDLGAALLALNPATAVAALGQVRGAADAVGVALSESAGARIEVFKRTIEQAFTEFVGGRAIPALIAFGGYVKDAGRFIRDDVVPPVQVFGGYLAEHLAPAARDVADVLAKYLVPPALALRDVAVQIGPPLGAVAVVLGVNLFQAAESVGRFIVETLTPALAGTIVWLDANREKIGIVAAVIGTVLLPLLIQLGVRMLIAGGQAVAAAAMTVAGWVASAAAAVVNAALIGAAWLVIGIEAVINAAKSVAASWATVAGWVASAAAAVANAAIVVGSWILMGAQAVAGAARAGLAYAMVIGGWIASAAAAVVNAAVIVGQWILMGAQSLLQAGRMAAAWVIAMGPVGWVIASVVGLTAIIATNWDTVKNTTSRVFGEVAGWAKWLYEQFVSWFDKIGGKVSAVTGAFAGAFETAKQGVKLAWDGLGEVAAAPVRFVVDKVYNNGIAKVWNWIAGKVGLPQLDHVGLEFARGGVVPAGAYGVLPGYAPGQDTMLAAVSPGEGWLRPEVVRWMGADTLHALNYKGRTGQLPNGMPAFGIGGVVGGLVSKAKKAVTSIPGVSDVIDYIGDVARGALAKAAEKGLAPVRGLINSMPGDSPWQQAMKGLPLAGIDGAIKWLKGEDDKEAEKARAAAGSVGAGAGQWAGLVGQVLAELGQPLDLTKWVLKIIEFESGGNPNAINNWDINAQNGVPSQGLMQTIPPTFNAYAGPYRGAGIRDPHANIYAGLNYGISRYGSVLNIPGVRSLMNGGPYLPYDTGGWLMPGPTSVYNATGRPEAVLTAPQWNAMDANRTALEQALRVLAERQEAPLIGTYNAAPDDDPRRTAEELWLLQRGRRGPRG